MNSDGAAGTSPTRRREPIFNIPGVILACCVVLLGIHAIRGFVSIETDNRIIALYALVPARVSLALHLFPDRLTTAYHALVDRSPILASQVQFLIGDGQTRWWTLVTYAFLHGSWAHVGFNCVWLVAFGSAVARRFSAARFLLLLLVASIAGALVQYIADVTSFQIVIGASAAVSGAMGAAIRFIFRPSDEPVQMFDRSRLNEAFRLPALTLRETFTTKATIAFVVFWFVSNLLFGLVPSLGGLGTGPIAWQAHIGGFLAGLLLFPLFDPARPALLASDEISADLPLGAEETSRGP
jgi:membrane associated rhomboid family serine protease